MTKFLSRGNTENYILAGFSLLTNVTLGLSNTINFLKNIVNYNTSIIKILQILMQSAIYFGLWVSEII